MLLYNIKEWIALTEKALNINHIMLQEDKVDNVWTNNGIVDDSANKNINLTLNFTLDTSNPSLIILIRMISV